MSFFEMDDFMDFMGYREMCKEDKVNECMDAIRRGENPEDIDCGDLDDWELEEVRREISRRRGRRY